MALLAAFAACDEAPESAPAGKAGDAAQTGATQSGARGAPVLELAPVKSRFGVGRHLALREDPDGALDFASVRELRDWRTATGEDLDLGFQQSVYWLRLRLRNGGDRAGRWILRLRNAAVNRVDCFPPDAAPDARPLVGGDQTRLSERALASVYPAFPLELAAGAEEELYLRLESNTYLSFPVEVLAPQDYARSSEDFRRINAVYLAFAGVLALYNVFLFFMLRDRAYLYYMLYFAPVSLYLWINAGDGGLALWPEAPWLEPWIAFPLLCLGSCFAPLFVSEFLQLPQYHRRLAQAAALLGIGWLMMAALPFLGVHRSVYITSYSAWYVLCFGSFLAAIGASLRRGFPPAWAVLLGWGVVYFSALLGVLIYLGLMEYNFWLIHAAHLARPIDLVVLSSGLAYRVHVLQKSGAASAAVVGATAENAEAMEGAEAAGAAEITEDAENAAKPARSRRNLRRMADPEGERLLAEMERLMREERLYEREDLDLDMLADLTGASRYQVSEVLNNAAGLGFHAYVNRFRVERAAELLRENPERSIIDVAHEAGFRGKSGFNHLFKKYTGLTPSEYRRR